MDRPVIPLGKPRPERADAARNRLHLLDTARDMIAECGVDKVTMDGLAERAGLGKGTVFRRFGTRAGIFAALIDEDEHSFQTLVLTGPPPLGPGADPVERLVAYGRGRITFLLERLAVARASLDRAQPIPAGAATISRLHIGALLRQAQPGMPDLDSLAIQLTAALEGPILLYLSSPAPAEITRHIERLADSWQALIERICA
ncbi:TetR/AcrR family transcriptional regulator [Actinomadura barringtoniae]|uniref:TetR/AcrR family transcriptional regulator n=1 Tax=Actinomadura barringtoniae TaxID=1427535 RepID=A0A939TGE8_9ACTN|nr:TetR/AcrR family transcriptional regulator [Actinomadura barringtoniae]MBO2455350.1 TetR/AcrR family transcriptional regulator [Actinomadura barringtoniae]